MPYQSTPTTIACDVAEMTQLAKRLGDYFTQLQEITIPTSDLPTCLAPTEVSMLISQRDVTSSAFGSTRPHMPSTRHEINSFITKKQALRPSKKTKAPTSRKLSSFTSPGKTGLLKG